MNSQTEKTIGQGLEGSQAQEVLFLWSWGMSPF